MDGISLNNIKIKNSFQNWSNKIVSHDKTWEGNNLHIDEFESLEKLNRFQWISTSFKIINILRDLFISKHPLIPFFHFDIKYTKKNKSLNEVSLNWLKKNVSEFTPPSLNYTTLKYFESFYNKELNLIKCDDSLLNLLDLTDYLNFYYRIYFDEDENMYSREIYIFFRDLSHEFAKVGI